MFLKIVLDTILVLASMYVVCKELFHKINIFRNKTQEKNEINRQSDKLRANEATFRGLFVQIILSLAITWSFLSFPTIYWNHKGEWFSIDILPFFDIIPLSFLQWPLKAFYASHNLFLLMSLLGIVLIAFLLALFANRMEAVQLVKRGLDLGKEKKRRSMVILSIPVLIGIFSLFLEILDVIPRVDWLMFAIMYPLIVTMLTILTPYAEKKGIKKQGIPQNRSRINLVKASIFLILTWGLWFLPLLLTGITDHMYVLLLVNLSISIIVFTFFEVSKKGIGRQAEDPEEEGG